MGFRQHSTIKIKCWTFWLFGTNQKAPLFNYNVVVPSVGLLDRYTFSAKTLEVTSCNPKTITVAFLQEHGNIHYGKLKKP